MKNLFCFRLNQLQIDSAIYELTQMMRADGPLQMSRPPCLAAAAMLISEMSSQK